MLNILNQRFFAQRPNLAMLRCSVCAIVVLCVSSLVPVSATESAPDVRVIVDISGSMKKNDPANLRVPAVKLLSNLLPSNSRAGVWTFGQYVNELVPLAAVTPAWQRQASQAADKIGSTGLYTNIGLALQRASTGWTGPATGPRHIILLTDGVVDISKNPQDNQVARDELRNEILPAIKATGAKLHTIALSSDADAALLQKLARETDGMFEQANNADELNRIFLRLFEQAAPRDALPLFDNGFTVDGSVDEITVLVFRKSGAESAALLSPDGTQHKVAKHPDAWRWHSDDRYDLITVAKPAAGQWQIQAELDPDNRVLVVSKLGLHVAVVPTLALAGEKIRLDLTLTEEGEPIVRPDFLKLVKAVVHIKAQEYERDVNLIDSGNGHFTAEWEVPALDANFELALDAKAPTFQRLRKFHLQAVATPVRAELSVADNGAANARFSVAADLFKPDSIQLVAEHQAPDQAPEAGKTPVPLTGAGLSWQGEVAANAQGSHQLHWRFEALTVAGRPIAMQGMPLQWQVGTPAATTPAAPTEPPTTIEPAAEPTPADAAEAAPETAAEPEAQADADGGLPWLWIGVGLNVVLVGIGLAFWWVKRRHKKAAQSIEQALADSDEEDAPP